jgi:putative CRISPR-associated protein (TIGR02620 family)
MSSLIYPIIVSRHAGAVAWLQQKFPQVAPARVFAEVTAEDVRDQIVVGNLPLHLAALCRSVIAIEFAGAPPRGAEYTPKDMEKAGARLRQYTVAARTGDPEVWWMD